MMLRRLVLLLYLAAFFQLGISDLHGQVAVNPIRVVPTDPSGACPPARVDLSTASGNYFYCDPMTMMWSQLAGGGTIPTIASTTNTLKGDGAGNAVAVTGTTDCVLANGSTQACATPANYRQTFSSQTTVALTHNLNTYAVISTCFGGTGDGAANIEGSYVITDVNTVTWTFETSQSGACVVSANLASTTTLSISTTCGVTGGPITTSGTISGTETVNAQTGTSYAILNGDCGKLVTQANGSAIADTIAQAGSGGNFAAGWYADLQNTGAGTITVTPTTSTINGGSSLTLLTGQGVRIVSDGTNYFIAGSIANGGTVQNITINNSTINNGKCNHCTLNGTELSNLFPNAAVTGTTLNKLAKLTGTGTIVITGAGDTSGALGICTGNTSTGGSACGTSGSSEVAFIGTYSCVFDNGTTADDYVTISASVAGDCHDAGATFPVGTQVLGRVLVTAAAGTRSMTLFGPEINTPAFVRNLAIPSAGCNGASAATSWNQPAANAPAVNCYGTSYKFGALDYDDAANETSSFQFVLPTGWTGAIDISVVALANATTQQFKLTVATVCIGNNEDTLNPTFNAAQTITVTSPGTANQKFVFAQTGVTTTGCAANELMVFKIGRDTTDTSTATLSVTEADLAVRVTPQA